MRDDSDHAPVVWLLLATYGPEALSKLSQVDVRNLGNTCGNPTHAFSLQIVRHEIPEKLAAPPIGLPIAAPLTLHCRNRLGKVTVTSGCESGPGEF